MRCASYCCGESYDLKQINQFFSQKGFATLLHEPEVLYVKNIDEESGIFHDIYIFNYGCITMWGTEMSQEKRILASIAQFLSQPLEAPIADSCKYQIRINEPTEIDEEDDMINLEVDDHYVKLSLSYGLSQSVKLILFENSADQTIQATRYIPDELIKTGKISLSREMVAKKIGELFAKRNSINLYSTILDTPEFFWRRPRYQHYYEMAIEFMDIKVRINILNGRLDVINELYGMLSNELNHIHTSRLEITIIFLILFEVLIIIFRDLLGWI